MSADEWLERWANAQIAEIEKVDKCSKEKYAELSKNLHDIEIELIGIASSVQELRATLDSISIDQNATTAQFADMIRQNSDNILKHSVVCPHPGEWKRIWDRMTNVETTLLNMKHDFDVKSLIVNHQQDLDIKELMVNARNSGMVAGGGLGTVCGFISNIIYNIMINKP